jgi:hypothetical protein
MTNEDLEYLRTTISTIDGLANEVSEIIRDNNKEDEYGYTWLLEKLEDTIQSITTFQEFKEWI